MGDKDYSATPLWKKLGIKERARVALIGAPEGFEKTILPGPGGVELLTTPGKGSAVIVIFATRLADVRKRFGPLAKNLDPAGGLWVAYPKRSSGLATDLTFENVQGAGLDAGLVDNKSCAIDATWSAVRFVYRLKDRPA
ncbi:MAG: DUF3052 domain-containing protein [Candidatus Binatia bacterium]